MREPVADCPFMPGDADGIDAFLIAMNAKYDAGMTADFLYPAVNATFAVRAERAIALSHDDFTGSPRAGGPTVRVNPGTPRMGAVNRCIEQRVQNLWGLTRRRALDFGRVTTAAC